MYTRFAALTAAAIMTTSTAFAATSPSRSTTVQTPEQCQYLVTITQDTAKGNDAGPKAQAQIDEMMTALQNQCNANQFDEAEQTAALIRGLVATE